LGDKKQIADGLMLRYDYAKIRKALGIPEEIRLTLIVAKDIAEGVLAGLITSWLLKKLGNQEAQVAKLEIDRTTVELEEDKIKKIIHEKIRKSS
jgi:bifunctional DNA-binding transcriptional regulator/antitoxin component of YhaV-PrlF toxin-antitoxin module